MALRASTWPSKRWTAARRARNRSAAEREATAVASPPVPRRRSLRLPVALHLALGLRGW